MFSFNATTFAIACNKFINNQNLGGTLIIGEGDHYNSTTSSYNIQDNLIIGNSSGNGESIIDINFHANSKDLYITDNLIKGNYAAGGSILSLEGHITNIFQVHHNDFINNTAQNCIHLSGGATTSNYVYCNMKYNNLVNPACAYEFFNNVPYGGPNITADSIYWGSQSSSHIDSVIYDYFDFANQSVLFYQPFLLFPTEADTACNAFSIGIWNPVEINSIVTVFPNPCSGITTMRFVRSLNHAGVKIFDVCGKLTAAIENISGNDLHIDCSLFSPGLYIVSVNGLTGQIYQCKLVVK